MKTLDDKFKDELVTNEQSKSFKKYNIAILSENSLEIYLIKKYLPKEEGYRVLEASSLGELLKISNYLSIDLIIIDDSINENRGVETINKVLGFEPLKECRMMLLLSRNYTKDELSVQTKNIEFVKKPIDEVVFKHRVMLLVDKSQQNIQRRSYFSDLALKRVDEAKEFFTIYHNIFLNDSNMMIIYDKSNRSFVESNGAFERFFGNIRLFNRVFFNKKLLSKSVKKLDEPNFLNYYDSDEWLDMITKKSDFNYSVKIDKGYEEYSFNIVVNRLESSVSELYLIKLINIYDYLPKNRSLSNGADLKLKEQNLSSFKNEFIELREKVFQTKAQEDEEISKLFLQLSSKLSIICDDSTIMESIKNRSDDLYTSTLNLFKEIKDKHITLNQKDLNSPDHKLDSNIYTSKENSLITKLINEIISLQIIGNDLEVLLYQSSDMIIYEFALLGDIDKPNQTIKELSKKLDASIEFIEEEDKSIVVVNIPK